MIRALNLAELIKVCGGIKGRKKIQKMVHLLREAGFGNEFPYDFGYLYFGPYSHGVKEDLDFLVRERFVTEVSASAGEYATYEYRVNDGNGFPLQSDKASSRLWGNIAQRLNERTPQELETASTIAYLRCRGFQADDLKERFKLLKPSLVGLFEEGEKIVNQLISSNSAVRAEKPASATSSGPSSSGGSGRRQCRCG